MAAFLFLCLAVGCAQQRPRAATRPIAEPDFASEYVESVDAYAAIPTGWHPDPLKSSDAHQHQVWLSPSGQTAYGIIHFKLPLPVGHEFAFIGFLQNMRKTEGEANVVSKEWDPNIYALRFVVVGGLYTIRTNLFVRGLDGWAVYAGTLRNEKINSAELAIAEKAREMTQIPH
jgi:hypothetical protein